MSEPGPPVGRDSMRRTSLLLVVALAVVACAAPRSSIATQTDGLRTFTGITEMNGGPVACPAFGLTDPVTGTLQADASNTQESVWLQASDGRHLSVVWPRGFSVRFEPEAVLYDDQGKVVGRQGERIVLSQVRWTEHAGTYADPYIASGLLFNGCYPFFP